MSNQDDETIHIPGLGEAETLPGGGITEGDAVPEMPPGSDAEDVGRNWKAAASEARRLRRDRHGPADFHRRHHRRPRDRPDGDARRIIALRKNKPRFRLEAGLVGVEAVLLPRYFLAAVRNAWSNALSHAQAQPKRVEHSRKRLDTGAAFLRQRAVQRFARQITLFGDLAHAMHPRYFLQRV